MLWKRKLGCQSSNEPTAQQIAAAFLYFEIPDGR